MAKQVVDRLLGSLCFPPPDYHLLCLDDATLLGAAGLVISHTLHIRV